MACSSGCAGECRSNCTGGCSGCSGGCIGCTNACMGCTNACKGSCTGCTTGCQGCSGCTGSYTYGQGSQVGSDCNNQCSGNCTGCGGGCSSDCGGGCSGCKGGCISTCTTNCADDCTGTCLAECADDCTGTCAGECKETCTGTCSATCADDCSGGCYTACTTNCANNCSTTATTASCGILCAGECMGCTGTCSATCADDCSGECKTTCKNTCENICTSCEGTCKESCSGTNSLIVQTSELEWIMPYVRNEIYRRSGFNEKGEFLHKPEYRHYSGPILSEPDDSLFILDSDAEVIRVGHGIPIIDMLLKVCDFEDARFVREFDLIPGVYNREKLINFIKFLSSTPFDSPISHCRGACTGLCDNNCTTTCTGSCLEECSACGKECSGYCSSACTGCSESCGKSCGSGCGDTCTDVATSCSGCSSGCSGCTGCVNTCEGTCAIECISSCSGCSAGCMGVSGLNDTCGGCSSVCTTGCGGKVTAVATTDDHHSVELYHNGQLYGKLSTLYHGDESVYDAKSDGDVVIPSYPVIQNRFRIDGIVPEDERWISELDGSSLKCARGAENTLQFTSSSPETVKYYSATLRETPFYSKCEVGISFGIQTVQYIATIENDIRIEVRTDSLVNITAVDSSGNVITGARTDNWGVYINSVEVALPYTELVREGDIISLTGDRVRYTVQRHENLPASSSVSIPFGKFNTPSNGTTTIRSGFGIVPYCFCRGMKIWFDPSGQKHYELEDIKPCSLVDNEHVKITSSLLVTNGGQDVDTTGDAAITGPVSVSACMLKSVPDTVTITVVADEFKEMCEDGSYIGILYTAGFELYEGYNYGVPVPNGIRTDGRSDTDFVVVLYDAETCEFVTKVNMIRKDTSFEQYTLTIPKISGYNYATNYTSSNYSSFVDRAQEFQFDNQYTVYGRNSFVLFLHK